MALLMKPVQASLSTSTSDTVDLTAPGLGTPKAAIIWSTAATTTDVEADHARMSIGFTDGTNQYVTCCFDEHNLDTTVAKCRATTGSSVMHIDGTSVVGEATAAFIADGIRLTMVAGFSAAYLVTALLFGDDGTGNTIGNVYVGTNTVPGTVPGTFTNSDPGFAPDIIICAHGPVTINDTHENNAQIGMSTAHRGGSTTLLSDQNGAWFSTNGLTTTSILGYSNSAAGSSYIDTTPSITGILDMLSFTGSGFDIRQNDADAQSFDFGYICMEGSAFTNRDTDHVGNASSPGDRNFTGTGFTPGCILHIQCPNNLQELDSTGPPGFSIAAYDSTTEFTQSIVSEDGSGTSNTHSMAKNLAVYQSNHISTATHEGTLKSFDADGWTVDFTTAAGFAQGIFMAFDSQEPVAPAADTEEPLTISTPASSRDTRLTLDTPPAGTTKTQWRITPPGESSFTIQTTSSGTSSANVSDSDLQTLNIWLPPSHTYVLETRHFTSGSWGAWSSESTFTSRGPLNSYEKYLALSGISGVDNVNTG